MLLSVLVALLASVNANVLLSKTENSNPKHSLSDYLLPDSLKPVLYEIELEPDFNKELFNGRVKIKLFVKSATNKVVLHVDDLEIDHTSGIRLLDENGEPENSVVAAVASNDNRQFYTITFEHNLLESHLYALVISFTGTLKHTDNKGFYVAKYNDTNGSERKLATSHLEPTGARKAFPCFDEPALKAEFEISLIRSANYNSISNTPKISTNEISNGRFQDKFERSVRMSTYLVAFIVSDFTYIGTSNQRVFARPNFITDNEGDYALRSGIQILKNLEKILNVPYALPKLDQIAIPDEYFSAGAMENWGLVTYKEQYLLYSNRTTDANFKESIVTTIAHEFAHQWFGNLVSPVWWTHLWLNEGFARYFQYIGATEMEKDMELENQMLIKSVHTAFIYDSDNETVPMNYISSTPTEIASLFTKYMHITYDKAASVIRMVEGILSTEVFRRGLTIYLTKKKFEAATPEDLYTSWQESLNQGTENPLPRGETVPSVLRSWESNAGYPLITVTRNYENGSVTFSQRRFINSNPNNDDESIWYVPISYTTSANRNFLSATPKLWLTTRTNTTVLEDLHSSNWLLVNIQQSGYYQVNYDKENWHRIINFLNTRNFDQINVLNRAQLIYDSFTFARFGILDYEIPLQLAKYLKREIDYIPFHSFFSGLKFLDTYISNSEFYVDFQNYILRLLEEVVIFLGFEEDERDSHVRKLHRAIVLSWACMYERPDCRGFALRRLREWQENENNLILPTLQKPLTCAALRIGEQTDWNFVFHRYLNGTGEVVRTRLLSALGCTENESILQGFLNKILNTTSGLRSTDRLKALSSIYNAGNYGRDYAYNYIKLQWTTINSSFNTSEVSSIMKGIAATFSTQEQMNDLKLFSQQVNDEAAFKAALRKVSSNVKWSNQYLPSIVSWLRRFD